MRILATDPGYERLGIAIIETATQNKDTLLYSDCFRTNSKDSFEKRLHMIGEEIERLIQEYTPEVFATEKLYFSSNKTTALYVAEVRGVSRYLSEKYKLRQFEYTPLQIKSAVTGHGKSDKSQIAKMTHHLIDIKKEYMLDDEYDAIAIALTCIATERIK
ncbi:MAG: crossover junction endodeoxyribonuclease RuvC [Candidatus Pacebacteria bacterium]|nr:crossover junction endodeoxyribonuclease RuvC [Candidatus Paceibacterota bacterium]